MSGTKHDEGKMMLELVSPHFIKGVGTVLTHGAKKYGAHNWRKGFGWMRIFGATLRHLYAWASGEDKDSESGLSHLWHAATNIMFLIEFQELGMGKDDREPPNYFDPHEDHDG